MSDSHLDISETIQPLEDDDVAWTLTDNTTFVIEGVLLPVLSTLGVIGSSSSQSSFKYLIKMLLNLALYAVENSATVSIN